MSTAVCSQLKSLCGLLTYRLKRRGPNSDPWEMPNGMTSC